MIDCLINILMYIISFIDKFERDDEKLIKSFELNNIQINTDTGFKKASHIHLTKSFEVYHILLENGYSLDCADNHIVFDENMNEVFVKDLLIGDYIQTNQGLVTVTHITIDKQKICMCDITIDDENHRYFTNGILSHNTTTSAIFLLWYALFNVDKNTLVVANKRVTSNEILDKIKKIYLELPYYLKPGIYKWNEGEIVFDNGCRIMAEATTINSGISFTFHCVLWDEAAHVPPNIKDKFYNNLFPTITAGKARFMITSTQNGYDLFYRLYHSAVEGENEYVPFKTDWWEVPEWNPEKRCWEKRDEEWHKLQVANYGSEEAFNKQFGTNFDSSANTLIDSKVLRSRELNLKDFIHKQIDNLYSNYFWWDPDYDIKDLHNEWIVITTDIAEGLGGDYTVSTINRLYIEDEEVKSQAIGFFKCNDKDVPNCASIIRKFCIKYLDPLKYLISLEYNLFGELYVRTLKEDMNNDFDNYTKFSEDNIVRYYNDEQTKFLLGVRMTPRTKLMAVTQFKQMFEKGIINNHSMQFMNELTCFCDNKGNNTFQATFGHDDLVMSQLQMACVMETPQFKEMVSLMSMNNDSGLKGFETTDLYNDIQNYDIYSNSQQDWYSQRFGQPVTYL